MCNPEPSVRAVICDFTGVLTDSIDAACAGFRRASGISEYEFASALAVIHREQGRRPLAELRQGLLTETGFLDLLGGALKRRADRSRLRQAWLRGTRPNGPFLAYLGELRRAGIRLALLAEDVHQVRHLECDAPFDVIVPAAGAGLSRLLDVAAEECLLVDDVWENCRSARRAGMPAVWFRSTSQARTDIDTALGRPWTVTGRGAGN